MARFVACTLRDGHEVLVNSSSKIPELQHRGEGLKGTHKCGSERLFLAEFEVGLRF